MNSAAPRPSLARRLRWPVSVLMPALLAAHSVGWYAATTQIMGGIPAFLASAAASGWTIEGGPPQRAGWPWAAAVRIPGVSATLSAGTAPLRWTAARVDLEIVPQDTGTLRVSAVGQQTIQGSAVMPLPFTTGRATLRVPLAGDAPSTLEVRNLEAPGLRAGRLTASIAPLAASVTASPVELLPPLSPPFDAGIALTARLTLSHKLPQAGSPSAAAAAWQAAGGEAGIPAFEVRWGPLHATGNARMSLDPGLQPMAKARVQLTGAADLLDATVRGGLLAPGPASAVRAVLGLLALAAKGGPLTVPVDLRDRVMTVAQFPLMKLPALDWNPP